MTICMIIAFFVFSFTKENGKPVIEIGNTQDKEVITFSTSYEGFNDLNEAIIKSDLIVHGHVVQVEKIDTQFPPQIGSTYYTFKITDILHNRLNEGVRNELTLRDYGYEDEQVKMESAENPLFKINEEQILFLNKSDDGQFYYLSGGPQSRYLLQKDQQTKTVLLKNYDDSNHLQISGNTLDELKNMIKLANLSDSK